MTPLRRPPDGRMRAALLALVLALLSVTPASAATHYLLDGSGSQVGFSTDFGNSKITGNFPVSAADLELDFRDVARSNVSVTLDVRSAVASFPFAAQAMKGPKVLDARRHPTIGFRSTRVRRSGNGAVIDHLIIRLTGAIHRSAFGATGWPDAVGDEVQLDITAWIVRVD